MNGWLELESDPGLFTLLVEDFGVEGVQVEEIYDLQKPFEGPIYGFIFLFRWMEERRARRKITQDEESVVVNDGIINSMFFAQQVIPNSCATHALLSVLLNCENKVKLGPMLTQLKMFTKKMTPEDKGYAIGNMPDLAKAHNSHARPEPSHIPEKQQGLSGGRTQEAFHYVSFVSINGHLFELDGLKPYPIDHGMEKEGEDWTEMFRRVITERLGMAAGGEPTNEIRFNLMVVVPDRQVQYKQKLDTLKTNHQIVCNALKQRMKTAAEEKPKKAKPESQGLTMMTRSARRGADANKSTESSQNFKIMKLDCQINQSLAQCEYMENPSESGKTQAGKLLMQPGVGNGKTPKKLKPNSSIEDNDDLVENFSQKFKSDHLSPTDDNLRGECEKLSISMEITAEVEPDVPMEISKDQDVSKEDLSAPSPTDVSSKMTSSTAHDEPPTSPDTSKNCGEVAMELTEETKMEEEMDFSTVAVDDKNSLEGIIAEHQEKGSWKGRVGGDKGLGSANQTLSIKDLLSLLNKVEDEIKSCENALKDEIEKRKKYKIDDCRRTHNYDEFIRTFLTMLAEQGHLANLVEQHLLTKKSRSAMPITKLKKLSKKKKKCKKKR